MILGFHHAQVTVPKKDEQAARDFYCGFLGLKEIEKPESLRAKGGFWLELGAVQVHVSLEDGVDRRATKAHLAYLVSDLALWRRRIEEFGLKALDGTPVQGYDRLEFRDPFGNRVELLQRRQS